MHPSGVSQQVEGAIMDAIPVGKAVRIAVGQAKVVRKSFADRGRAAAAHPRSTSRGGRRTGWWAEWVSWAARMPQWLSDSFTRKTEH